MTETAVHEHWMRRCFELGAYGIGNVAPNPLVGCVIVKDGECIAEGYHRYYGAPHAEPDAISRIANPNNIKGATLYVNLEPCSHQGKTPPCAPIIVHHGIKKVVISNVDPFPKVNGTGIQLMNDHGIEVITDILQNEGEWLNRRFFTFHKKQRPWIILKWAQSADGFIAPKNQQTGEISWISGIESQTLAHKWRAENQAILVGVNTIIKDNPALTVRHVHGANPIRIVLDPENRIPTKASVLIDGLPTVVFNMHCEKFKDNVQWVKTTREAILHDLMKWLYNSNIQSLIVEGGAFTLNQFIKADFWDEARVFSGNVLLQNGISAPTLNNKILSQTTMGNDNLITMLRTI